MPVPPRLLLRDTTVVSTADGTLTAHQDVLVESGTITAVVPEGSAAPEGATVVDASGTYAVPGFLDMHAHPLGQREDQAGAYELMLAHGITGFRQMSGSDALLAARRAGDLGLPRSAPTPLAMPGDLLTPMNAGDEERARAAVRHQHAHGADFIKAALVTAPVLLAVLDQAAELGIPVAGHLPAGLDPREAARRGMRAVEHLGPGVALTSATAGAEPAIRAELAGRAPLRFPSLPERGPLAAVLGRLVRTVVDRKLRKLVLNPATANTPADVHLLDLADTTFDEGKARALAELFVEHETWQCPTLIRVRTQQRATDPAHAEDPALRWVSEKTQATWRASNGRFTALGPEAHDTLRRTYDLQLRLTGIFDEAGVPLLAGTDACGAAWVIPGHSLHQEFDELTAAGLSPLRVLQTTTSDAARFLGMADRLGSVGVGRAADLVLLGGDPTASASALHDIRGVVREGRHLDAGALGALRDRVARERSVH